LGTSTSYPLCVYTPNLTGLQKVYIEQNRYPKFAKLLKHLKINPVEETLFTSDSQSAKEIIKYLNNLEGIEGFIYKNYSPEGTHGQANPRKYFTGDNAKRIDAIREKIEEWKKSNLLNEQRAEICFEIN